jgi:hypothetical protein
MNEQKADLSAIKQTQQAQPQQRPTSLQAAVYEIPLYQTMTAKDGSKVDVLVNVARITRAQLQAQVDVATRQLEDARAKLDAITAMEEAQVQVVPPEKTPVE